MYNRYIPNGNGSYERHTVPDAAAPPPPVIAASAEPSCDSGQAPSLQAAAAGCASNSCTNRSRSQVFGTLDLGDLLLLCIVLLLLLDGDEDDIFSILITVAAFLTLQ